MKIDRLMEEKERIGTWGYINPERLNAIFKFSGKKVLDIGCSKGEYVRTLIDKGYDAYGFDIIYHEEWKELEGRFKCGDIINMPYKDEEFDTVLLFEVLEHLDDLETALKEVKRVVKRNIFVSVPDAEMYPFMIESGLTFHHWIDRTHVNFFTEKTLKEELTKHGFEIVFFKRINPVYPEIILFKDFGFSLRFSKLISRAISKIHKRRIFMTLLCVGEKMQ